MHLFKGVVDEQSNVVLLSAGDFVTVDNACLANTKAEDATVPVEEGANVL